MGNGGAYPRDSDDRAAPTWLVILIGGTLDISVINPYVVHLAQNSTEVRMTGQTEDSTEPTRGIWQGRFPENEIISLLDLQRTFNLAESTSHDLTFGDLLEFVDVNGLQKLRMGYGPSAGLPALRQAVADSCGVPFSNVLTTQGTALALFLLAFEICRPGDEAVLVTPCFPPSRDVFSACGVHLKEVKLQFDRGYELDVARISELLSSRTRLVSLASPQNPSGVCIPHDSIRAVLAAIRERAPDALLFVDETYREAVYGDADIPSSAAAIDQRIVVGASISKAYGAPGLRTGWMIVANAQLRERLTVAKMNITISGSVLDETLSAGLLKNRTQVLQPRRKLLSEALESLAAWHAGEHERLDWVHPSAGALCCFRLAKNVFDASAVRRFWEGLPGLDLQLASGAWFGEEDRVFRLGFGYLPPSRLQSALSAVSMAFDRAVCR